MRREAFLKLTAGVLLAPYFKKLPTISEPISAAETTLTLSPGVYAVGDVLRNVQSGEAMMITRLLGNQATVQRGMGTKGPRPIYRTDDMKVIASAFASGAAVGPRR